MTCRSRHCLHRGVCCQCGESGPKCEHTAADCCPGHVHKIEEETNP